MTLDAWMTKRRLSLAAVAALTGLHKTTLSRLKRGLTVAEEKTAEKIIAASGGVVSWRSLRGRRSA